MSQADARIVKALEGYRGGSALRFGVDLASTGELINSATLLGFDEAQRLCELATRSPARTGARVKRPRHLLERSMIGGEKVDSVFHGLLKSRWDAR